jgi:hypothetical protein
MLRAWSGKQSGKACGSRTCPLYAVCDSWICPCMSPVANRYALVCCLLYTNLPLCAICGPWMCPVPHGCTVVCRLQLINMPLYVVCGIQLCPCTSCTAHRYALVRHLWHMTLPTSALVRCLRLIDMPLHAVGPAAQYVSACRDLQRVVRTSNTRTTFIFYSKLITVNPKNDARRRRY